MANKKGHGGLSLTDAVIVFILAVILRMGYGIAMTLAPGGDGGQFYYDNTASALQQEVADLQTFASPALAAFATQTVNKVGALIPPAKPGAILQQKGSARFNAIKPIISITAQHVVLRIFAVFCSWPLALVAILIGVVQGLTTRARRRYKAELESAFIYQHSRALLWLPLTAFFIYLCLPIALPFYTLAVVAWLVVGGTVWVNTGYFQKHIY